MNRRQKTLLTIFGILDLIVVIVGAGFLFNYSREFFVSPPATPPPACSQWVLAGLPPQLQPAIAWEPSHLYLRLRTTSALPVPPPEGSQILWQGLDAIAAALQVGCASPENISISVTIAGQRRTDQYQVHLAGAAVSAWAAGTLTMEELAARGQYKVIAGTEPRAP